jgi:argininosuccinate lyase
LCAVARITQGVLVTLTIHGDKMNAALIDDMLATDIADYLVPQGFALPPDPPHCL